MPEDQSSQIERKRLSAEATAYMVTVFNLPGVRNEIIGILESALNSNIDTDKLFDDIASIIDEQVTTQVNKLVGDAMGGIQQRLLEIEEQLTNSE